MTRKSRVLSDLPPVRCEAVLLTAVASIVLFSMAPSRADADFIVSSWRLATGAADFTQAPPVNDINTLVANPFYGTLGAAYGNSIAQAAYQYNWNLATGHFDNSAYLEAQGGPDFLTTVDNLVRVSTSTDVLLSVDAQWDFHLAGGDRNSYFDIVVGQPGAPLLIQLQYGSSPIFGDPASAVWNVHESVLLPAGGNYFFRSVFTLDALSGSPAALSSGTGFANFTLTSLPEPAALGLLAFAALLLRTRSHRRT